MRIEVGQKLENNEEDIIFSKDMSKNKEMRNWNIENERKRRGGGAEREKMGMEPKRKRRRLRTATDIDQSITRDTEVDLIEKSGCGTTETIKGGASDLKRCGTSKSENVVCGKTTNDVKIVTNGCGTATKNEKGVASAIGRCGKSEGCGNTSKVNDMASVLGDGKDLKIDSEGCGTPKNNKGVASDLDVIARCKKNECGTCPTREPGCGKLTKSKKREAVKTAGCGTCPKSETVGGKSAKSDKNEQVGSGTSEQVCGKPAKNDQEGSYKKEECGIGRTTREIEMVGCGIPGKAEIKDRTRRRKGDKGVTKKKAENSPKIREGLRQGDLLGWIEKGGGGNRHGGVADVMKLQRKGVATKTRPEHQKELDWLKSRCTECGNSLSWSPDGQGICTTLLKSPERRKGGKSLNRKRKRERKLDREIDKEDWREKGEEEKEIGSEEEKEKRLNVLKIGQIVKMGKSAEVAKPNLKLSKTSKNVSKIKLKGSTEKKKFKGGRKGEGRGKGENVRKITVFFETLGNC